MRFHLEGELVVRANYCVGSALQLENEVRITAELMHAATQTTLWSEDYTNTLENVLKLHSEVALKSLAPSRTAWIYVAPDEDTRIVVNNSGSRPAALEITLTDLSGRAQGRSTERSIQPGAQEILVAAVLLGQAITAPGIVRVESDVPVGIQGLTTRGSVVVSESPTVWPGPATGYLNIPRIQVGGGYQSEVVLINPSDETLRGELVVHGLKGGDRTQTYVIAPGGAHVWSSGFSPGLARTGYVTVRGENELVPAGGAWVSLSDEDDLWSRTYVAGRGVTNRVWIPVDTYPTHQNGRSQVCSNKHRNNLFPTQTRGGADRM